MTVDFKFDAYKVFIKSLLKFVLVGDTARANPTLRVLPYSLIIPSSMAMPKLTDL